MRRFLGALLVVAFVMAGCGGGDNGGGGGGGGGGADLPVAPIVIFGTAYDPATLAVAGKAGSLKAGTPMVAVGRAFTARPPGEVTVVVSSGSSIKPARPVGASNSPDSADLFATDLTPDRLTPGTWQVEFHAGGRIIASGFLAVTP
ncbi:MAG: hypothetical protein H0V73_11625 [Chloroflexi bacterium]|nr:hypothetical protein [Chloroflexota bacterium]